MICIAYITDYEHSAFIYQDNEKYYLERRWMDDIAGRFIEKNQVDQLIDKWREQAKIGWYVKINDT